MLVGWRTLASVTAWWTAGRVLTGLSAVSVLLLLVGGLVGWLVGCQVGWLVAWLVGGWVGGWLGGISLL